MHSAFADTEEQAGRARSGRETNGQRDRGPLIETQRENSDELMLFPNFVSARLAQDHLFTNHDFCTFCTTTHQLIQQKGIVMSTSSSHYFHLLAKVSRWWG